MSADLFAEFSTDSSSAKQHVETPRYSTAQPASSFSFFDNINTASFPAPHAQLHHPQSQYQNFAPSHESIISNDDNDDWGDFEGSSTNEPASTASQDPFTFTSTPAAQPTQNWSSNMEDPFASDLGRPIQPIENTWQKAPIVKAKRSADPSVLFDAEEDFDGDDDFGNFEGTEVENRVKVPPSGSSALTDLLGDLNASQPMPPATSGRQSIAEEQFSSTPSRRKKSIVGGFGTTKQPAPATKPATPKPDDDWDTFDDWEASIPTKAETKRSSKILPDKGMGAAHSSSTPPPIISPVTNEAQPGELPPTNVPPPGVLLSLFPTLFAEAQDKLFKPMAAQTLPMRNKLLAEPATIMYLEGYLMLANVVAHIIAGRKLRWKRDQHLSQGMKIGPASSRATSGMKLTGIDKGENMKEERETSDVVRVWKEQVGRLRHIVSGANQIKAGTLGLVPDVQETMSVKTLKQSEGGIPARLACMMCGLKREERVTASDMVVEDSFGEWWIDQVSMHRGTFTGCFKGGYACMVANGVCVRM
ncbi:hypothetical protein GQ44DRAFT_711877 [Phaeosphaeriaceae sp. PMI808]|nr:hypothetical protein GQ44DRAFT_711877 [Phaeosphaeriaceae sp. PMI808]